MTRSTKTRRTKKTSRAGAFALLRPSFAEFVAPQWLENMAWYSLHPQHGGLTEDPRGAGPGGAGVPRPLPPGQGVEESGEHPMLARGRERPTLTPDS